MRYRIEKLHINDFDVLEEGKAPARSYFIPFSEEKAAEGLDCVAERYGSDIVTGSWRFRGGISSRIASIHRAPR